MSLGVVAREAASVPSTSGRVALAEMLGRAAPVLSSAFSRSYASLVGSGFPSPRPDVALHLSTPHGGHINRMINTAESILELDGILYRFRKRLRPANIGAASMKLEHLHRYERASPYALKVQRVAAELQKYVETFADRLALTQVANVVRGMSSVSHRLPPELLVRLAAGVVADGGAALRYAPDVDLRDLCYGFSGQGYANPLFWSRVSSAVLPRLPSLDPNTLPAIIEALQHTQQLPIPTSTPTSSSEAAPAAASPQLALARDALRLLASPASLERLQPARLADAAHLLRRLGPQLGLMQQPGGGPDPALLAALQAATLRCLPALAPGPLTGILSSLLGLHGLAAGQQQQPQLPAELLVAAEAHLRAAVPRMELLHVKQAVQVLAPSAGGAGAVALGPLLELLARRAVQLLPAAGEEGAAGAGGSSLARLPRGGKDAGAVLAAAVGPQMSAMTPGVLEGLMKAYAAAAATAGGVQGGAGLVALVERVVA
ncbi:hypothetical protein Agub_g1630, partial [Astrephomene gubernaculifera]